MITLKDISFAYEGIQEGISTIEFNITQGECVVLCGKSGSGKSTITRLLNGLIPELYQGELSGNGTVAGLAIKETEIHQFSQAVGSVFQNPKTQFFTSDVISELVFGCENLGLPREEIEERLNETISTFQLEKLIDKRMFELSGGEKQLIACASVHMLDPSIIVLDEPSSNLDVHSINQLSQRIKNWKEQNKTIVIAEHRLYYLVDLADRYFYIDHGELTHTFSSSQLNAKMTIQLGELGLRSLNPSALPANATNQPSLSTLETLTVNKLYFHYPKKKTVVIDIDQLTITNQETTGIVGKNGAGKSTLIKLLSGLVKPKQGDILFNDVRCSPQALTKESFIVMQDIHYQLFCETVKKELLLNAKFSNDYQEIVAMFELEQLLDRHPLSLSGGQKQRVAIASAVLSGKKIIFLDEPTSGLDAYHMRQVYQMIRFLKERGIFVIIVSHDLEFLKLACDRIVHLSNQQITSDFQLAEEPDKLNRIFDHHL